MVVVFEAKREKSAICKSKPFQMDSEIKEKPESLNASKGCFLILKNVTNVSLVAILDEKLLKRPTLVDSFLNKF